MESDVRFYRRRANEEMAAANRAVTEAARARRRLLAGVFLQRLEALEQPGSAQEFAANDGSIFAWADARNNLG